MGSGLPDVVRMRTPFLARLGAALVGAAVAISGRAAEPGAVSRELVAPGPEGDLAGTLLLPDAGGAFPTALLIPDSGPTDRNGDSTNGVTAGATRLLAQGLAARGIASLRTDKRGLYGSARAVADPNAVSLADYADDVESWLNALDEVPELSHHVWLAGHGEGSLVALTAAARELPNVRGVVLIAAPGRPLGRLVREQLADNPANAPLLGAAFDAVDALERGDGVDADALHPGLRPLFKASTQDFLRELFAFDPAAALGRLHDAGLPALIVHGGRDTQVSDEDARLLQAAHPDARTLIVADMNHVLKTVSTDDRAENLRTYADRDLPLSDGVVDGIADFVEDTR